MDNLDKRSEELNTNKDDIKDFAEKKQPSSLTERLRKKKGIGAVLGGLLVILSKLKFLLVILKFSKFASTFISMIIMILVYAQMYGWAFGVGFVVLLFIHEMGHYLTAKHLKLDVSVPIFIPFMGAFVSMKESKDVITEAKTSIGGPILGSIGALFCFLLYFVLHQNVWLAIAYTGFVLNLFNLIPIHPLDGGRTVSAISPKLWLIGIPVGVIALFKFFNPMLLVILLMGIFQVINQLKNPDKSYYDVPVSTRIKFALIYFGLMALLGIGITYIHSIFNISL